MKRAIGLLAAVYGAALLAGCSGSTPGFMTPSKPRSASEDPTMDPWERVGAQMKEKPSPASAIVVPQAAPVAAAASAPPPAAAPAAPAPKPAQ